MSKPYHCFRTSSCRTGSVRTIEVAEITAGTPKIIRYSCGARYDNFSSFSTWTVKGLKAMPAEKTNVNELDSYGRQTNSVHTSTVTIESVPFKHQNSSEWCMVLEKTLDALYLSVVLIRSEMPLRARLRVHEIIPSGEKIEVFPSMLLFISSGGKSEQRLVRRVGEAENEDEIILECEVSIECMMQGSLLMEEMDEPHVAAAKGLSKMFEEGVLADFELHTCGTVLKAHKALLSVHSPYFAAMLQPHTKEAKEGRVELSDVTPEVLKQVLLYMYKGVAPALKDMPWDLLIAADKYQLQQLKRQCENHLASILTVDNAAEYAASARMYSCAVLWDCAVLYIKLNLCEVMSTPGWLGIITTHPEAVQRISELMVA